MRRIPLAAFAFSLIIAGWRTVTAIEAARDWFQTTNDPSARELYALSFQVDAVTVIVFLALAYVASLWRPFGGKATKRGSMTGYNFTEDVRRALAAARSQAAALHHEYVGTEHMLLGLLQIKTCSAVSMLTTMNVDLDALRSKLTVGGRGFHGGGPDLPYTSRGKRVLEQSMAEARDNGHTYVGTEHVLLGLLREQDGLAAKSLAESGVTVERARPELLKIVAARLAAG